QHVRGHLRPRTDAEEMCVGHVFGKCRSRERAWHRDDLRIALGPQQFDRRAVDAFEQHDLDAVLGEREALAVRRRRTHAFSFAAMLPVGADVACSPPPNARAGDPVVEAASRLARRELLPCPTHPWVWDYKGERARLVAFGSGGDILFDDPAYPERIRSEVMT